MNRIEAWLVHAATLLVGGTGVIYAWMRYFARSADEFSVVNHPLQPTLQHLHLWTAPLLVFAAGLIWRNHVWDHFRRRMPQGRRTGLVLMVSLVPMVVSGYLIQTTVAAGWRSAWIGVHLVTSGLWILSHVVHVAIRYRRKRRVAVPGGPSMGGAAHRA